MHKPLQKHETFHEVDIPPLMSLTIPEPHFDRKDVKRMTLKRKQTTSPYHATIPHFDPSVPPPSIPLPSPSLVSDFPTQDRLTLTPYYYDNPLVKKFNDQYNKFKSGGVLVPSSYKPPSRPLTDGTDPLTTQTPSPLDTEPSTISFTQKSINHDGIFYKSRMKEHKIFDSVLKYLAYFHDHDEAIVNGETKFSILNFLAAEGFRNENGYSLPFDIYRSIFYNHLTSQGFSIHEIDKMLLLHGRELKDLNLTRINRTNNNFNTLYKNQNKNF